jgi:hypothetical protein
MEGAVRVFAILPLLSVFVGGPSQAQVCETPNNQTAIIYQPCTWHIGDEKEALAKLVALNQHYSFNNVANSACNVNAFFIAGEAAGIFYLSSHGSNTGVLVEAYHFDSAVIRKLSQYWISTK